MFSFCSYFLTKNGKALLPFIPKDDNDCSFSFLYECMSLTTKCHGLRNKERVGYGCGSVWVNTTVLIKHTLIKEPLQYSRIQLGGL